MITAIISLGNIFSIGNKSQFIFLMNSLNKCVLIIPAAITVMVRQNKHWKLFAQRCEQKITWKDQQNSSHRSGTTNSNVLFLLT